jgi:transcriptional regulator with XRE-family HTH domain
MLSTLIKEELNRRNMGVRDAAKEIGVSHSTIYALFNGRPLEVETAYLICRWLKVPLATAVQEADNVQVAAAAIEVLIRKIPDLEKVLIEAVDELNKGNLTPDDFRDVIEFAAYKIQKRRDTHRNNEEQTDGGNRPADPVSERRD